MRVVLGLADVVRALYDLGGLDLLLGGEPGLALVVGQAGEGRGQAGGRGGQRGGGGRGEAGAAAGRGRRGRALLLRHLQCRMVTGQPNNEIFSVNAVNGLGDWRPCLEGGSASRIYLFGDC